jgi:ABC-type multidrug transport system permease subunit
MSEPMTPAVVGPRSTDGLPTRSARPYHPLAQLTFVRLLEFVREPEAVFWALVFPVLLASGLGIAFRNRPAEVVKIASTSPALADSLRHERLLDVQLLTAADAEAALGTGTVALVADPGPGGSVVYRYDDTNPEGRTARLLADAAIQRVAGQVDPVHAADRLTREPGSRYIDFLIPGLVGMGIMGNAVWGIGFSIVDARRRRLMKRIVATPMRRRDYLLSFLCFRMLLLGVEVGVPVLFGLLVFGVPVRGPILALVGVCVLGSLAFSAIGLLVASRVRTIEAVSSLANVVMLPMWVLSGVFFSAQRFPDFAQPAIKALPLTALVDALRANMLQGADFTAVGRQAVALGGWLVVSFVLALKLFRWR